MFWKKSKKKSELETKIHVEWPEGTEHYSDGPIWAAPKNKSNMSQSEKLLVDAWKKHISEKLPNLSYQEKRILRNFIIEKLSKPYISVDVLPVVLNFLDLGA
jgi:hypothetical protein